MTPSLTLRDIVERSTTPIPWAEGEKIPWHDPAFSARMLREHLSQAHDAASRRAETIARQVAWIQQALLNSQPSRVLDLGCGPGLYTAQLAALGHRCVGIDFSPAAIAYAREAALAAQVDCVYALADLRDADFGAGYDLIMLLYGEFNVFRPTEARAIVRKARRALAPAGRLLLEVHPHAAVRAIGAAPRDWQALERGLFADMPYLRLDENVWDEQQQVATTRHYIIDAATGAVTRHAQSMQAYHAADYHALLAECGFPSSAFHGALDGSAAASDLIVLVGVAG